MCCGCLARTWWWLFCCFFGGESGYGLLVFGCGGDRQSPGWDVADAGVESEDVASSGGPRWVIIINAVVVGTEEGQVVDVGVSAGLPGDDVVDVAVVGWFVTAGSGAGLGFSC